MYKIVNNNISITRGETATYNVRLIDKTTGAPFRLPAEIWVDKKEIDTAQVKKFVVVFSVRRSDYIKDGYAIKKILWLCGLDTDISDKPEQIKCDDVILLDDNNIYTYDPQDVAWSPDYDFINTELGETQPKNIKALFRRKLSDGTYEYKANIPVKNGDTYTPNWVDYSFIIRFPFLYQDTAQLSPKSYKYSMTIYGGTNLTITDGEIDKNTIDYKKPLVDAEFIVGADINE